MPAASVESSALSLTKSRLAVYRQALSSILPPAQQTLLLQSCLSSRQVALAAWNDWLRQVRDPKSVFERDPTGLRGLLPFIRHALSLNGIKVSGEFCVYLQVSSVREELRSHIYGTILADTLLALRAAGCDVIVLRAAALSETVYDKPSVRHNHAIELLIHPSHAQRADQALVQLPFQRQERHRAWQRHSHSFIHESGLPLLVHTRPLLLPHYQVNLGEIWKRSKSATLSGVETNVLSPSDALVDVCGHASYSPGRRNLRWVCDAVLTLRQYPAMNWDDVAERAHQYRLAPPLWVMFEYLARQLHAPVPEPVLIELSVQAASADRMSREAAIMGILLGAASPIDAIRRLGRKVRARILLARFLLLPSRTYMSWRYGVNQSWLLPFVHLYRFSRFAVFGVKRLIRRRPVPVAEARRLAADAE